MTVLESAQKLQQLIGEGKQMEALDQFYDENVVITEVPTGEVRKGLGTQKEALKGWVANLKEMHGAGIVSVCANEETGVATAESWFDCTFQNGKRVKDAEVAVQQWKNGKIVEEKFYYHIPGA